MENAKDRWAKEIRQGVVDELNLSRLRDEFAMAALTGALANSEAATENVEPLLSGIARTKDASGLAAWMYLIADAMMEARK